MKVTMWASDRVHVQTSVSLIDFIVGQIDHIDHDGMDEIIRDLLKIRNRLNKIDSQARTCQIPPGSEQLS